MNIDPVELNARMDALASQRNESADRLAVVTGLLMSRDAEIERLKKEVVELKGKLAKGESDAAPSSQEQQYEMGGR